MERQNNPSRLTLKMQTGFDAAKGVAIVKSYSFGNVEPNASDEAVHEVANTLANLSELTLDGIIRTDTANLA